MKSFSSLSIDLYLQMKRAIENSNVPERFKKRNRGKVQTQNKILMVASDDHKKKNEERSSLLKEQKYDLKPEFFEDETTQQEISRARKADEIYQTCWKKSITVAELEDNPKSFPDVVLSFETKILPNDINFRLVL